jgi:crotonyl-CoA carboxylase/reductase
MVSSAGKGELCRSLGATHVLDRNEFTGMMRRGGRDPEEEAPGEGVAALRQARRGLLGAPPDVVFEHVGKATFPTSVLAVKPFGKVVICGATSGYQLDFDVRYLWMRQKQIIGATSRTPTRRRRRTS